MRLLVQKSGLEEWKTKILVVGLTEEETEIEKRLDHALKGLITEYRADKTFTGENGTWKSITPLGRIPAEHVLLYGLGKSNDLTLERLRKTAATSAKWVRDHNYREFATTLHTTEVTGKSLKDKSGAVAEGVCLGLYAFDKYKTFPKDKPPKKIENIHFLSLSWEQAAEANVGIKHGQLLSECQNLVRELVNEPGSILIPAEFAKAAENLSILPHVTVKSFGKDAIKRLGFGGLEAVSRGSAHEPRFVVIEYRAPKSKRTIALVGKGITFDSGGLDIKPGDSMVTMKGDMGGAAAVLATIKAVATLRLPITVIGCMPCADNMLGGAAYKPGDIIRTYNKKTIEIMNTDAEGRVVLADALAYAEKQYKPDAIIDIATLTGAVSIALGQVAAGVFGTNDEVITRLKRAADETGERIWQLPLYDEYKDWVKSKFADVRNTQTKSRQAGASTAAAFLSYFVESTPWAHLDIASVDWYDDDEGYHSPGGSGFGVRLLTRLLEQWSEEQ